MSSYGLDVRNNSGRLLIGSAVKTLSFVGKITGTTSTSSNPGILYNTCGILNTGVQDASNPPVIFFVPYTTADAAKGLGMTRLFYSSGYWRVQFLSHYTQNLPIEAYVFTHVSPGLGYGLQVYNSDGGVAFDSSRLPLVLRGVVSINRSDTYSAPGSGEQEWILGSGSGIMPVEARIPKIAISVAPFFYGCRFREHLYGTEYLSHFALGGIRRSGDYLHSFVAALEPLIELSPGVQAPLWSGYDVPIIDASMYD